MHTRAVIARGASEIHDMRRLCSIPGAAPASSVPNSCRSKFIGNLFALADGGLPYVMPYGGVLLRHELVLLRLLRSAQALRFLRHSGLALNRCLRDAKTDTLEARTSYNRSIVHFYKNFRFYSIPWY